MTQPTRAAPGPDPRAVTLALTAIVGLASVVIVLLGQWHLREWFIEDAAISFAYARNLAEGYGLVPWPGGERIEGYSNPTWTGLLALLWWLGADPFPASKLVSAALAVFTLPFVWLLARRAREGVDLVPIGAVLMVALDSRYAIWASSGLENALVTFLVAATAARVLVERDTPGARPWSAVLATLVAVSRPEGPMYAAWLGVGAMAAGMNQRSPGRWIAAWIALSAAPFFAYHGLRWAYFAWPLPNTYYAKVVEETSDPFSWTGRGWLYLRRVWSFVGNSKEPGVGLAFALPLMVVGATGARGWRGAVVAAVLLLSLPVYLLPAPDDLAALLPDVIATFDPGAWLVDNGVIERKASWTNLRVWLMIGSAALSGLLLIGRERSGGLVMAWIWAISAAFFTVYTGGDWMKGYRWAAFLSVPVAILTVSGAAAIVDGVSASLGRRWPAPRFGAVARGALVLAVPVVFAWPSWSHFEWFSGHRETSPHDVRSRVNYMTWVQRRLHLDRVTAMDVDMGAHMWWSGWEMVDMAALVDVPMARHLYEKPFVRDYVFVERKPEFAHVHGGWATRTRIPQNAEWRTDYLEIPGFPSGKTQIHPGNHIRRDLVVREVWEGPPSRVDLTDGFRIEGWSSPYETAAPGEHQYLEIALSTTARTARKGDVRVVVFLTDGASVVASWAAPPGYDWYPAAKWKPGEVVLGRYSLPIPPTVPEGSYTLGFVAFGPDGGALSPVAPFPDAMRDPATAPPVMAVGEIQLVGEVRVVTADAVQLEANELIDEAVALGRGGACDAAFATWERARLRLPKRFSWQAAHRPRVYAAVARCLAARAEGAPLEAAVADLALAQDLAPEHPLLAEVRGPWVVLLHNEARSAEAAGGALRAARLGRCDEAASLGAQLTSMGDGGWLAEHRAAFDEALAACAPVDGAAPEMPELERSAWDASFLRYSQELQIDPTRAWTRRDAERVRDLRLGLDPEAVAAEAAAAEERKAATRKRAEDARRAREAQRDDPEELPGDAVQAGAPPGDEPEEPPSQRPGGTP